MLPERFESKYHPEPNTGCWLWTSSIDSSGYGGYWPQGPGKKGQPRPSVRAHRFAYQALRGPIPEGLGLDHLCRVRSCVNPDHLEPVTSGENTRRGITGWNMRSKTHCPRGHELAGANLYAYGNRRHCRTCRAVQGHRAYEKRKTKARS